jgi:hypothetical protein
MPKDWVNQRNDDFSGKRISERKYGTSDLEKDAIEGFTGGTLRGEFNRFIKSVVPANPITKKSLLSPPSLGTEFSELVRKSIALETAINDARNAEGDVYISGRLVPGIFQGFRIAGGVVVEKFDQQKYRDKLVNLPKDSQLFQIDKGVKPFSGSAKFVLLDDPWSTALQKAREFIRIMTFYKDGADTSLSKLTRVFRIESFLVGADRPFNFSTIKIIDYSCEMGTAIEGQIDASFDFEQFEVFTGEAQIREPESRPNKSDSGVNINELTIDENPLVDEPITVP